ncbi:MAG TPA: fimbria/pilus periplasmic chaperone [Terracidiphilus sp.]|nr:fimbria/pilus periplasmic chaperone [Terracidiphilus sp.]
MFDRRINAVICAFAATLVFVLTGSAAEAQALSVQPVNVFLAPGQRATTVTVSNQGTSKTAVQIRAYSWKQQNGDDQLTASDQVVISPPIATIPPGGNQVVRLILRLPPLEGDQEFSYRIIVDQIPPPAEPGIVHIVLRLSIPIFAEPTKRAAPNVQFHLEVNDGELYLVGINNGLRHDVLRDIELSTSDGRKLKPVPGSSPYILAGATRRWSIAAKGPLPLPKQDWKLTAQGDEGAVERQVRVASLQAR